MEGQHILGSALECVCLRTTLDDINIHVHIIYVYTHTCWFTCACERAYVCV